VNTYAIEIVTVPGSADSAFLDRLADVAFEIDGLRNLHMGLNPDASVTAMFDLDADDPLTAAERGVRLFAAAVEKAQPLAHGAASTVGRFSVSSLAGHDLAIA
jgi:hypothetical protein